METGSAITVLRPGVRRCQPRLVVSWWREGFRKRGAAERAHSLIRPGRLRRGDGLLERPPGRAAPPRVGGVGLGELGPREGRGLPVPPAGTPQSGRLGGGRGGGGGGTGP